MKASDLAAPCYRAVAIGTTMAAKPSPVPLRVERTVSTDTTAASGNATLLSMQEET